jgi:hypothetical protein
MPSSLTLKIVSSIVFFTDASTSSQAAESVSARVGPLAPCRSRTQRGQGASSSSAPKDTSPPLRRSGHRASLDTASQVPARTSCPNKNLYAVIEWFHPHPPSRYLIPCRSCLTPWKQSSPLLRLPPCLHPP